MRRLCVFALSLVVLPLFVLGCSTEDKRQWADAMKDLRGDNMEIGSHNRRAAPPP